MRLTVMLIIAACLKVTAGTYAQSVTFKGERVALEDVFSVVKEQTGYVFFYEGGSMRVARPVSIDVNNLKLQAFLDEVLKDQPLDYTIENKTIFIKKKAAIPYVTAQDPQIVVSGRLVHGATGEALIGATVNVVGTKQFVAANEQGDFKIRAKVGDVLLIRFIGFQQREVKVTRGDLGNILLSPASTKLDEAVVQAYGFTSKRLNTGNIEKVSAKEIANTPVGDPILALQGRVPGMIITQTSGVPGSPITVEIRGRTRVDKNVGADNEPLYIINGVPLAAPTSGITRLNSAITGSGLLGMSPLSTMNMADIESVEVLKDADATAIYGSRGANGVILITTRKGKAGKNRIAADIRSGISNVRLPDLLSTKEYVAMRKEAFFNDGKAMNNTNAYDLLLWDTTRDNNLAKQLIGGNAEFTTANVSMSGGTKNIQFMVGGNYDKQTNVYPDKVPVTKAGANFSINTVSEDGKFTTQLSGNYVSNENNTVANDLAGKLTLPPNYLLYDAAGNVAWNEKGIITDNPLAYLKQKYSVKTDNVYANAMLGYRILPELQVRASIGYNSLATSELRIMPKAAQNPANVTTGSNQFGNSSFRSWIAEPQLEYTKSFKAHRLNVLAGGTFQSQRNEGYSFTVNGYTSDEFLGSLTGITAANFGSPSSNLNEYKYNAFFGRINYNYESKYIVNLSGRRDGSSRFGPNFRFSNFGAVGGAWLFTSEEFMKDVKALSFGKLRASYGVTGNDRIGDYKYLDSYTSYVFYPTYKDSAAFVPTSLFKPDLHWERNKKLEFALELGFLNDRVLFNVAWYRNRSSDPLVNYPLPNTTGFNTITANLNGVLVDNTGWEMSFTTTNFKRSDFDWTTGFNISVPKNELVRFPGLASSSYATSYIIGRPLNIVMAAKAIGVDPLTGLYMIEDRDKNGVFGFPGDLAPLLDTDPDFYGGLTNSLRYKNFSFDVLLQFNRQQGKNWLSSVANSGFYPMPVGGIQNVAAGAIKDRWQQPGDIAPVQKYTTNQPASNALSGNYVASLSDYSYTNASYLRVKNIALSYTLPASLLKRIHFSNLRVYAQAQNMFTFTSYKGVDPETVYMYRLPPLRTTVLGIQIGL
ncbi:SusC/RagA family TonB-linked outer membrane protein [uncultured Chitinophaga sp.]|uniref:SusC/RagA family TonB-linked outer membrane protein n=1 Tax=uncultured Chitinophaga sp. TaxID=339340 RepID=UPI0025D74F88|nr:SusC/RagA family TonB-linked outer membrane protein [uncultured Chitinophaga sp.]